MHNTDWFITRMKQIFDVRITKEQMKRNVKVSYYNQTELRTSTIPLAHIKRLPEQFLVETFQYTDEKQNDWLAVIVLEEETKGMIYEFWIKNGEPIAYEIYE